MQENESLIFHSASALSGSDAPHPGGFDLSRLLCRITQILGKHSTIPGQWDVNGLVLAQVWQALGKHGLSKALGGPVLHVFTAKLHSPEITLSPFKVAIEVGGMFFSHKHMTTLDDLKRDAYAKLTNTLAVSARRQLLEQYPPSQIHEFNQVAFKRVMSQGISTVSQVVEACVLEEKANMQAHHLDQESLAVRNAKPGVRL